MPTITDGDGLRGFRQLSKQLEALGPALGGKYLRSAALSATLPVVKEARNRIPENDRDFLAKTYKGRKVAPGFAKRNIARRTKISRDKSKVRVMIGVKKEAYYAIHFVELGTSRQRRQPWLEPSFRRNRTAVVNRLGDRLRSKLNLTARRTR